MTTTTMVMMMMMAMMMMMMMMMAMAMMMMMALMIAWRDNGDKSCIDVVIMVMIAKGSGLDAAAE